MRVEAARALARWQLVNAPHVGVASFDYWRGRDFLKHSLADLFLDESSQTPLPIGMRVVRGTVAGAAAESAYYRGSYASAMVYLSLLEGISSLRANNGATPLDAAQCLLDALNYADDDGQTGQYLTGVSYQSARRVPCDRSMDKSFAIARLLTLLGDVHFDEEVKGKAEEWSSEARGHAQRFFSTECFRRSHNSIVGAAALQAIGALSLGFGAPSQGAARDISSTEWSLRQWCGPEQPDYIRLVALFGTIQQDAASCDAQTVIDGLSSMLEALFDAPGASDWLRHSMIKGLISWIGNSFRPGGVLANTDLLFIDQTMPGVIGFSSGWKTWYTPDKATARASRRQCDLAKQCLDLVRGASGYRISNELCIEDHSKRKVDRAKLKESAVIFISRLWSLINNSPLLRFDQCTRMLLRNLWQVLFQSGNPPCLKGDGDLKSLIPGEVNTSSSDGQIQHEAPLFWASGPLEGILEGVRRRRAVSSTFTDQPKRARLRLKNSSEKPREEE